MGVLEEAQNADGGWPYEPKGGSWTEPTAFALLAGVDGDRAKSGIDWLRKSQNSDGGWSPKPKTGPSTWVTALAAMLPIPLLGEDVHRRGVDWLLRQTGQESDMVHRIRQWMLGNQDLRTGSEKGWPWYPGAAAWVMPTAISLLALRKEQKVRSSEMLNERIDGGIRYLLAHTCKEGGWNHGSTHALGYEAKPYPETTGIALLALRGVKSPEVDRGIAMAEAFFRSPNPAGVAWLRLGLQAQGRAFQKLEPPIHARKSNVIDQALDRLDGNPNALLS